MNRQEAAPVVLLLCISDVLDRFGSVVPVQFHVGLGVREVNHPLSDTVFAILDHYAGGLYV